MKTAIHPTYNNAAKVTCACGNNFTTGSTKDDIHIEICHLCHPFYTGKSKVVDTAGRVERFEKLRKQREATAASRKGKKVKKARQAKARADKTEKADAK